MHTPDEIVIKVNKLTLFVRFSLDLLGDLEDTEWRDTVQLYQEKVRGVHTVFFFLQINVLRDLISQMESDLNVFQKTLLRYYLFEGLRYIWLDRKGAFCRVRY